MDRIWAFIFDILIGILIIFVSVAIYFSIRTEAVKKTAVRESVRDFMAAVKKERAISLDSYEELLARLSITNEIYHIELEHVHELAEPEYRFRTLQEVIEDQNSSYPGKNEYYYREVITYPPEVDDPVFSGELNTETNESVLASAVNTPADPNHVHTDDCYLGTKHVHTGSPSSGGGCYGGGPVSSRCGASLVHNDYKQFTESLAFKCTVTGCPGWCYGEQVYLYIKCTNGHYSTYHQIKFEWKCDTCSASFYQGQTGAPQYCNYTYSSGYTLNCGKIEGRYYNGDTEVFPICHLKVISIAATHPVQTVAIGDPLITTVRASYLDGSTKVVLGSSSFSTASPCQHQIATISYTYTLGGSSYTLTCTIDITVIPRSKTCSRGHIYNLRNDGSDPGCPYCKAWVDNIRVIYPATSSMTIIIGTTLQENGLQLLVTYMDGHTEIITSGYDDNLDRFYLGTKTVTIGYKGAVTYITVTTVCAKTICEICGSEYSLYPDGSDPGCPYCIQKTPIFTGNVLSYEEKEYTEAILDKLTVKGRYNMETGDTFAIKIKNKSSSGTRRLLQKIFPTLSDSWIIYKESEKIGVK